MLDHIGIDVSDYEKSKAFYKKALAPLGYQLIMEIMSHAGFGVDGKPDFWISQGKATTPPVHVAFQSKNRATVGEFYDAAIKAGGKDNGPPGIRAHYHPNYYGAFVLDPDGHNIETVCHDPE